MTENNSDTILNLINRISIMEQAALGQSLQHSQVTVQQAMLLKYIETHPHTIQADIVKITRRKAATVSVLLAKMEKNGLISRTIPADNSRNKELALTEDGHALTKAFSKTQQETRTQLIQKLNNEQQLELVELLKLMA